MASSPPLPPEAPPEGSAPVAAPPLAERKVSIRNILWPLLLSLSMLGIIGYSTFDLGTFRDLLNQLNPWLLLAALGTVAARIGFGGLRISYCSHGRLSFRDGVRSQLAWDFFAYVTPSTIGGGPFAAVFVAKDRNLPLGESTSIFLFMMLMDQLWSAILMPTMVILSFYLDVFPDSLGTIGFTTILVAFVAFVAWVVILAYSTLYNPRLLAILVGTVFRLKWLRRFRMRALRVMGDVRHRSTILRSQPPRFYIKGFALTVVPWLSRYALPMFLIWSVYPALDHLLIFLRGATLQLSALFLPTPGGAGAIEGLYLLFFGPPLMPESLVAPTLLAWRLLSYYLFIFAGIFIALQFIQRRVGAGE